MNKIIFFDIDGTLFNVSSFINLLHQRLIDQFGLKNKDIEQLKALYDEVKKENGYFLPSSFLDKITSHFPFINKEELKEVFYNIDLFEKSVYKDTSIVKSLADSAIIGIFSQGEENFQKRKIVFIKNFLDEDKIYIFLNKLRQAIEVFPKYSEYDIFLVDDNLDLLKEIKSMYPGVHVILIDRNDRFGDNKGVTKIKDLNELKSII